jgi:predicted nucleic acid-binding protein
MDEGEAAWCDIVALELFNGCKFDQRQKLARVADKVPLLETDDQVWSFSRQLALAARANGVTAPAIDVLIAACARLHGVEIEHKGDDHFKQLSAIPL